MVIKAICFLLFQYIQKDGKIFLVHRLIFLLIFGESDTLFTKSIEHGTHRIHFELMLGKQMYLDFF